MGISWGQIKHVTGVQHKLSFRLECFQDFEGHAFLQLKLFLSPNSPLALTMRLQKKNVIAVEMGTHTATLRGITDHQVV